LRLSFGERATLWGVLLAGLAMVTLGLNGLWGWPAGTLFLGSCLVVISIHAAAEAGKGSGK
jgi:hypothetical protein